ncbi:GPS-CTERM domain-containing protein [Nocardia sp. XZ_19_385]|uniref:GPS-CTERM domain-containing protein n=1 Tax=Nocardia sp. XZ_19_385 TaxID=2769488 RepID=UPI00188FB232|nr:GPS-CTERM domain-containing protein [Nocardia sp. XZ_19_385]
MIRTVPVRVAAIVALLAALPIWALPARAAPGTAALQVSASTGLTDGQRITVNGTGFRPGLASVAVGLCKQGFTSGTRDCDLGGGATFVNVTDEGTLPTVTLTAHPHFNVIDCLRQQCVIAAAPLPGTEPPTIIAANSAEVAVTFTGSRLTAAAAPPTAPATADTTDIDGPSLPLWSATAALLVVVAGFALADRRRL